MKFFKKFASVLCSAALMLSLFTTVCVPASAATAASLTTPSVTLRVEGIKSTLYSDSVGFTKDESAYDILAAALTAKNIPLVATKGSYGHYITSIGGNSGTYPVWWHFIVNGKSSDVGADSYKPADGDDIVFYIGDDSKILYPTITMTPNDPKAGQKVTVNVSATYTDYNDNSVKTVKISGVAVTLNGKTYTTDADGNAVITMPAAGSYTMTAAKEKSDTTEAIVRTGEIPVKVSAASSSSTGTNKGKKTGRITKKAAVTSNSINSAIKNGAAYILKSGISDWSAAVAYSASGRSVPQSFFSSVKEDVASGGTALPVHLAGVILGIKAAGGNPRSFNGSNLVAQLYNNADIGKSGLNGYTYGLLALDCGNYAIPASVPVSRGKIITEILSYQKSNGAFTLAKNSVADSDMTAIAVTALAPYIKQAKVKKAVNAAVSYLSKAQKKDGGFLPSYSKNEASESTSQVIIALSSVGIDVQKDKRFIKKGGMLLNVLMKYKKANGGFAHTITGGSDSMATNQAVTALAAYKKYKSTGKRIYDMTAVSPAAAAFLTETKIDNPDTGDTGSSAAAAATVVVMTSAAAIVVLAIAGKRKLEK